MDYINPAPRPRRWLVVLVVSALAILLGARWLTGLAIDWQWWGEIGQRETWLAMLAYGTAPALAAALLVFAVFFVAHARGLKAAGTGLGEHPLYARLSALALLLAALMARSGVRTLAGLLFLRPALLWRFAANRIGAFAGERVRLLADRARLDPQ